ncbi:MAG: hypothetical protein INR62_02155 [Rhodospirillales bacterium]|nr:hypothetical protein [Acetobacter sp.]
MKKTLRLVWTVSSASFSTEQSNEKASANDILEWMSFESQSPTPEQIKAINTQASVFMKAGIQLLYSEDNAEGALIQFDKALQLRSQLPTHVPMDAYGLAACWLNRAEALTRQGPTHHSSALHAYNQALALLRPLPLAEDGRFGKRLVIASQNVALLFAALDPPGTKEASAALQDAIRVLNESQGIEDREHHRLLTVTWMNLANLQERESTLTSDEEAWRSAQQALTFAKAYEQKDEITAEAGLKARHVLCRLLARRLESNGSSKDAMDDIHQATDLAEDGLELARSWERRGVQSFQNVAFDLFQFGAKVYANYQPQFLAEYLGEHLGAAPTDGPNPLLQNRNV